MNNKLRYPIRLDDEKIIYTIKEQKKDIYNERRKYKKETLFYK